MGFERGARFLFFYGKMVSDTEIQKVLIISDKKYADKANGRDGGVGTETQIISAEVYKIDNKKNLLLLSLNEMKLVKLICQYITNQESI